MLKAFEFCIPINGTKGPRRQKRFVLDGEAVILGVDGISDFNALHSGCAPSTCSRWTATICASFRFTCARPTLNACSAQARRPEGIFVNPFERGESKQRDRPYQGGRSKHWIKIENRKQPAMEREM